MKTKTIVVVAGLLGVSFLFNGCASQSNYLPSSENTEVKSISLKQKMALSEVLNRLQYVDGNYYMLSKTSIDPKIPKNSKFKIASFSSLSGYIESTTDYKIRISKNKYRRDLPKIVEIVQSKTSLPVVVVKSKKNIEKKGISISNPITIKSFLKKLGKKENKYYLVEGNGNIPTNRGVYIDNYKSLAAYIEQRTSMRLEMKKDNNTYLVRVKNK